MGDWNCLKATIVPFMEALHATLLPTYATFSASRNAAPHFNDLVFYKGVDVRLVKQVSRLDETTSDHDALVFRIVGGGRKKGCLK